jgi:hypothetical protein
MTSKIGFTTSRLEIVGGEHLVANSVRLRRYPVTIRDHAVYLEI